jgi:beta-glucosidase-like glycosyl hydrolase
MDAIKKYVQNGDAAAQAVIAGNDMIISGTLEAYVNEILKALDEGRITEVQIDTAARRVIACKLAFHLIEY